MAFFDYEFYGIIDCCAEDSLRTVGCCFNIFDFDYSVFFH